MTSSNTTQSVIMILLWCHLFWHHDCIPCSISYYDLWCHLIIIKQKQYYCIVSWRHTGSRWNCVIVTLHEFVWCNKRTAFLMTSYKALCLFHHRLYCDGTTFVFFKSLCHITLLWCNLLWWDCKWIALFYDVIWVFCCIHCDHDITGFFHRCHNRIA